jgi:hypothetical protein
MCRHASSRAYKNAVVAAGIRLFLIGSIDPTAVSPPTNALPNISINGLDSTKTRASKQAFQGTPKSLGSSPRKGSTKSSNHTCNNHCKRDCDVQISPRKKSPRVGRIEIDNLSIVEISSRRRRRLFVVSIDMMVNLQDMEPATAVPRKPLRIASSAIIVCVESLPAYQ